MEYTFCPFEIVRPAPGKRTDRPGGARGGAPPPRPPHPRRPRRSPGAPPRRPRPRRLGRSRSRAGGDRGEVLPPQPALEEVAEGLGHDPDLARPLEQKINAVLGNRGSQEAERERWPLVPPAVLPHAQEPVTDHVVDVQVREIAIG